MRPSLKRWSSHLFATGAGALLLAVTPLGSRLPDQQDYHEASSRSAVPSGKAMLAREAVMTSHPSPGDIRSMIEKSAAVPLLPAERTTLLEGLLKEWADVDPESLLPWLERQGWLPRTYWPSLEGLAARKPELFVAHIREQGDYHSLLDLTFGNPQAALEFGKQVTLPQPSILTPVISYNRLVSVDPTFASRIGEMKVPEERLAAWRSVAAAAVESGRYAALRDLWRQHPEIFGLEDLTGLNYRRSRSGLQELVPDRPLPGKPMSDPLQTLAFLRGVQQTYRPGMDPAEWDRLAKAGWSRWIAPEETSGLAAVADGDRSPANLEIAARTLLRNDRSPVALAMGIQEPVFRQACLRELLAGGYSLSAEDRSRALGGISDPALRGRIEEESSTATPGEH